MSGIAPGEPVSAGEAALWAYLEDRGLPFRYEPFAEGPNPDFVVTHPKCGQVIMDAYEPTYRLSVDADASVHSGFAVGPEGRLRRAFKDPRKAKQAQRAVDLGSPFVLVFARTNSEVDFESHQVIGALFGTLQIVFQFDEPDDAPVRITFGQGGRLQEHRNTRFSAVAVISGFNPGMAQVERIAEGRFTAGMTVNERVATVLRVARDETEAGRLRDQERVFRLKIFHNPFAAIPLPPEFAGPLDDQWMGSREEGAYYEAAWGIRGAEVPGREALKPPDRR